MIVETGHKADNGTEANLATGAPLMQQLPAGLQSM